MKACLLPLVVLLGTSCKDSSSSVDAAPSAQPSASAPAPVVLDTHGKWFDVASKSKVYTAERLTDADNAIRLLPEAARNKVRRALDEMAGEKDDAEGLEGASQSARDGQERVDDANNPAAKKAMTTAAFIVLHGLIAKSCADHPDMPSLKALIASIREMPLPHVEKGNGMPERLVLEQEMRAALDEKTMKAVLASAPPPKKSPP